MGSRCWYTLDENEELSKEFHFLLEKKGGKKEVGKGIDNVIDIVLSGYRR